MRNRRELLMLLGAGITGLAGCGGGESSTPSENNSTGTRNSTPTPDDGTPREETGGETQQDNGFIRPEDGLAEEAYNEVVDTFSPRIDVDPSGDTVREKVRDASLQGARQGRTWYENQNDLVDSESAYTAMAAAATVEGFDFEDGDVAIPHLVYNAGQVPANILQFEDGDSDLLTCDGENTDRGRDLHQDWADIREGDASYWDVGPAQSHYLDADGLEETLQDEDLGEIRDSVQQDAKESFSALAYNNDPHQDELMDVGITVGSWDALYAAEEKITNGDAKDVFDDITALANHDEIDNFAFGYDEELDEFVAVDRFDDREYDELNPFEYLGHNEQVERGTATGTTTV